MAKVTLKIKVSKKDGVKLHGFAYDEDPVSPNNPVIAVPVSLTTGKGEFPATRGVPGILTWGIRGEAGGSMKVEVFDQNDVLVNFRERSSIGADGRGVDILDILI